MKTKPKLLVCALIFFAGGVINLFFSTALHGLLTRQITRLSFLPMGGLPGKPLIQPPAPHAVSVPARVRLDFGGDVLPDQFPPPTSPALTRSRRTSRPPKAVGQYQHGSARWMREEEMDSSFDAYLLDPGDPAIRELLQTGYEAWIF